MPRYCYWPLKILFCWPRHANLAIGLSPIKVRIFNNIQSPPSPFAVAVSNVCWPQTGGDQSSSGVPPPLPPHSPPLPPHSPPWSPHGAHSPGEAGSRGRSMSVGGNRTEQEANNTSCQVSQQEQEANSTSSQVPQPTCSSWKWTSRLMPVVEPD